MVVWSVRVCHTSVWLYHTLWRVTRLTRDRSAQSVIARWTVGSCSRPENLSGSTSVLLIRGPGARRFIFGTVHDNASGKAKGPNRLDFVEFSSVFLPASGVRETHAHGARESTELLSSAPSLVRLYRSTFNDRKCSVKS